MAFESQWWEHHYQEHGPRQASPNSQLAAEVAGLPVGTALDAGCGEGADAVWLAQQGWKVTAVDISPTAVRRAEEAGGHGVTWVVADLTVWAPPEQYDLVVSQYVHPAMPFGEFVTRLARAVAPGGTLFVVGHDHADRHSADAPEQAWIATDAVTGALGPGRWDVDVAEARTRHVRHGDTRVTLEDVVVKARRRN